MHARKRSINMVSSSIFCMFIKKEENLRLTVYKIKIVRAQLRTRYCTQWAPKVVLGAWFFSVPEGGRARIFGRVELIFGGLN